MNHKYIYVYLDETKKLSTHEACFGGIVTFHRPIYLEKIYKKFLENNNINYTSYELKSYDKKNESLLENFCDFLINHDTNIHTFGMVVKNYSDHIDKYLQILEYLVKKISHQYPDSIVLIADKVNFWEKRNTIRQFIYNRTDQLIDFRYENSHSNYWLQFADLFCWLLRRKYIYTYDQKDYISDKALAFPIDEIFLE